MLELTAQRKGYTKRWSQNVTIGTILNCDPYHCICIQEPLSGSELPLGGFFQPLPSSDGGAPRRGRLGAPFFVRAFEKPAARHRITPLLRGGSERPDDTPLVGAVTSFRA